VTFSLASRQGMGPRDKGRGLGDVWGYGDKGKTAPSARDDISPILSLFRKGVDGGAGVGQDSGIIGDSAKGEWAMGDIFVNVGTMDVKKASKEVAEAAKKAMQDGVKNAVKGKSGFTLDKKGSGYTVSLTVSELKVDAKGASCKLSATVERYPTKELVVAGLNGNGKVTGGGKPESLVADCIGGVVGDMMDKAIPEMKKRAQP
jgi:hypothetical protein